MKWKMIGNLVGAVLLIAILIFSAYTLVPFVRYLSIPITGGTKAPAFQESPETAKINTENKQNYFNTKAMGNGKTMVSNISEVPNQGGWLNTAPLNLKVLAAEDKLLLINFWSSTDLRSYRSTVFMETLWQRYKNYGLVVIGVDAPEFDFEENPVNVLNAIHEQDITYPVVTDAKKEIWKKFGNHFVSAHYLIDRRGEVVYSHFGEQNYTEEEQLIRQQLMSYGWHLPTYPPLPALLQPDFRTQQTPSLYVGPVFIRRELGADPQPIRGRTANYAFPSIILPDRVYLAGTWKADSDYLQAMTPAKVTVRYTASTAYVVLAQAIHPIWVEVQMDNAPVPVAMRGSSIVERKGKTYMQVVQPGLYFPLADNAPYGQHILTLITPAGLNLYAFKFAVYPAQG
ncbi:MAG: redoxin family protein [Gammaproteobacteria bacterium]|nr:redoxin family protein [Gammaproteobacteria bacterium]